MSLVLAGRRVVVAGGGAVATRRVADLVESGAAVDVVAPATTAELERWADEGRITVHRRPFETADLDGAWLALAATDDPVVNGAVLAAAEARGCFASSATAIANAGAGAGAATFRPMAVVRRGDLEVAVGTSGCSPGLAAWLRDRLAEGLGPELAALVALAGDARAEAVGASSFRDVTGRYETVEPSILEAIRAGRWDEAREGLRTCLS